MKKEGQVGLAVANPLETDGKLSVHGTGMATYRAHSDDKGHQLIVKGNFLVDRVSDRIGVRHLFTSFFQEPNHLPTSSPALNRQTDYLLKSSKDLKPFVMTFFAVPNMKLSVTVNASFHINDLECVPPDTGWGGFSLLHHTIVWFYYRTKHMDNWPQNTHVCYYDGFDVPFFIGTGKGTFRLEIRRPSYDKNADNLIISIPMVEGVHN